jgi:hypothetical protein
MKDITTEVDTGTSVDKLQGPFFGLSKKEFTQDEIKCIAQYTADALEEFLGETT